MTFACLQTACVDYAPEILGAKVEGDRIVIEAQDGKGGLEIGGVYVISGATSPQQMPDGYSRAKVMADKVRIDGYEYVVLSKYDDFAHVSVWQPSGVENKRLPEHRFDLFLAPLTASEAAALERDELFVFVATRPPLGQLFRVLTGPPD